MFGIKRSVGIFSWVFDRKRFYLVYSTSYFKKKEESPRFTNNRVSEAIFKYHLRSDELLVCVVGIKYTTILEYLQDYIFQTNIIVKKFHAAQGVKDN